MSQPQQFMAQERTIEEAYGDIIGVDPGIFRILFATPTQLYLSSAEHLLE